MIFKTQGGFEIELKDFITYGDSKAIQSIYLESVDVSVDEFGKTEMKGMKANAADKANDKAIELLVISVNGNKENVLEQVKNLPMADGKEIENKLNELNSGSILGEKKTI